MIRQSHPVKRTAPLRATVKDDHAVWGDGYRKLEDYERLARSDETALVSLLLAGSRGWESLNEPEWDDVIGRTVTEAIGSELDGNERLFRRSANRQGYP